MPQLKKQVSESKEVINIKTLPIEQKSATIKDKKGQKYSRHSSVKSLKRKISKDKEKVLVTEIPLLEELAPTPMKEHFMEEDELVDFDLTKSRARGKTDS